MSNASIFWIIVLIAIIVAAGIYIYWVYNMSPATNYSTTLNSSPTQTANTVRLGSNTVLGQFLVDANGKTLYYFANDSVGKSNCTGQCSAIWPAFYISIVVVPSDLNAADFGQITTVAGSQQTTYKGWPLYYYSGDKNPGDTNGQGFQNIWFVAAYPFYNVVLMNNSTSKIYLADINGKALYYYKNDIKGALSTDPRWTIFDEPQAKAPALLDANNFKEFTRAGGQAQLSYKGYPLYLYSGDTNSGDTKGDALNKLWYLSKP